MFRLLALVALVILPFSARAQDTEDDTSDTFDTAGGPENGAAWEAGEEGGGPGCACASGLGAVPALPLLATAALLASRRRFRGYFMSR